MSNLQPNCCLKFDFQKVDQHVGGKWLIHDNKRRKDNQLQSLKLIRLNIQTPLSTFATYALYSYWHGDETNRNWHFVNSGKLLNAKEYEESGKGILRELVNLAALPIPSPSYVSCRD